MISSGCHCCSTGTCEVEQQGLVDLEDARGVLGPLEVAAHPEAVFGDARDHRPFSITQVSLLPPPWLELTTSDPFTSAVRVRPPGSTQVDVPLTMYGRRSTCRGARPSSVQVGQVDSVTTGWAM